MATPALLATYLWFGGGIMRFGLGREKKARRPPGPEGWPLVGNLLEFREDPLQMMVRLSRVYGDVAYFRLARCECYLFSRPDSVRYILRYNSKNFKKAFVFDKMRSLLGNGLLTMSCEDAFWRKRRRLSQPPFHHQSLRSYVATWGLATELLIVRYKRMTLPSVVLDVYPEMVALSFDLAVRTLFSSDSTAADSVGVRESFDIGLKHIKEKIEGFLDIPEWIPTARNRLFVAARRRIDSVVHRLIEERRSSNKEEPGDFLSALLSACDESDAMDARQLRDEVVTMFIAGFETNGTALAWAVWLLSKHPRWQRRVHDEVSRVLADRSPTYEDISKLELTGMFLNETMRLYPPSWWLVRSVINDDEIGGWPVAAGSLVAVSQFVTHRHPDFWERPDEFDPLRFSTDRMAKRPQCAFFPFGDGPRSCIGNRFAIIQMKLVLALLVQNFQFRAVSNAEIGLMASATLRPNDKMLIEVAAR